jgi:hypothetical protein
MALKLLDSRILSKLKAKRRYKRDPNAPNKQQRAKNKQRTVNPAQP